MKEAGAELHFVDRGGSVTFHGPGQLVGYPILDLGLRPDVMAYVHGLEEVVIRACADAGVPDLGRNPVNSGVWAGDRKVCAIGVRVQRMRWTLHGFALNCTGLSWYDAIVPCGLPTKGSRPFRSSPAANHGRRDEAARRLALRRDVQPVVRPRRRQRTLSCRTARSPGAPAGSRGRWPPQRVGGAGGQGRRTDHRPTATRLPSLQLDADAPSQHRNSSSSSWWCQGNSPSRRRCGPRHRSRGRGPGASRERESTSGVRDPNDPRIAGHVSRGRQPAWGGRRRPADRRRPERRRASDMASRAASRSSPDFTLASRPSRASA